MPEPEFEDTFQGGALDLRRWLPFYISHWSSRDRAAARYRVGHRGLRLLIEADHAPWRPEFDDGVRVSSLQSSPLEIIVGNGLGR
jgi:hypothetical protein